MAAVAPAGVVSVMAQSAIIAENGAGTYTAEFALPPQATLVDIIVEGIALWAAGTSAALIVGDAADDDGWLASINVKATDLLAGESISLGSTQTRGGNAGAYITVGTSTHINRRYSAAGSTSAVIAKIVSVGAGTTGRTRVTVLYTVGEAQVITQ